MLPVSAGQSQMLQMSGRASFVKVEVRDSTNMFWNNMNAFVAANGQTLNFVKEVTITDNVDQPSASVEIVFWRDVFYYNLSPLMAGSILNINGTLVDINRQVRISVAVVPLLTVPQSSDYVQVFYGRVFETDFGPDTTMVVQCTDMVGELMSWWNESIFAIGSAGGVFAETVMQGIINTVISRTSYTPYLNTLYSITGDLATPFKMADSPGWALTVSNQESMAVMTALTNINAQIAWLLRQKWNANVGAFVLTWYDPVRTNTTSTWTFTPANVIDGSIQKCGVHLGDIRNVVHVIYKDATPGLNLATQRYVATDNTSINLYGRQFMQLGEESSFQLNSSTQAALMALGALSDLAQPKIDYVLDVPLFWPAEVTDVYKFTADGRHFDSDQTLAVVGWQHKISSNGLGTTTLTMRGKPSGGIRVWFDRQWYNVRKQYGTYNASPNTDYSFSLTPNSGMSQSSKG